MRLITLSVCVLIAGCGVFSPKEVCDQYGAEAGETAAAMCVSTIKENADAAQKRWTSRAEAGVPRNSRKEP